MPAKTYPNLGLKAGYDPGEDNWGGDMTDNMVKLSILTQGNVKGRVAVYPASPVDGDVYVNTDTDKVAARIEGAWVEWTPQEGWLLFDRDTSEYITFDGGAWAVLETGGGGGGLTDAPADGKTYGRKDAAWAEIVSGGSGGGGTGPGTPVNLEPYGKHRYWRVQVLDTEAGNYAQIAGVDFRSAPGAPRITPTGTAIASGSYDGSKAPLNAFDNNATTVWESQAGTASSGDLWVGFNFDVPVSVVEVLLTTHVDYETDERPRAGKIQYSDNGSVWTDAWGFTGLNYASGGINKTTTSPSYSTGDSAFLPPYATTFPIAFTPSGYVSTLADKPLGLSMRSAIGVNGNRVPSFTHTVPATDWSIVAKVKGFFPSKGSNFTGGGICVRSSTNTMLALMYEAPGTLYVRQYRDGLYYDGERFSCGVEGHDHFLKIARIGASLFFYVSDDNDNWVQVWTETIANWLGSAAEAGIMTVASNVVLPFHMLCDYYKKTV